MTRQLIEIERHFTSQMEEVQEDVQKYKELFQLRNIN